MGEAVRAARLFLYHHEAFHHQTECFATRLELTHRRPFFKTGFERLYQATIGTKACLEEGLANANALEKVRKAMKNPEIEGALVSYVRDSPPGYDQGELFRPDMLAVRCQFAEENQNLCLPHIARKNPDVWRAAPQMFTGIANINARVNYVIPRNSPLLQRMRFRPLLTPRQLITKLTATAGLEFIRHGSCHDIYRARNGANIEIPRHPRDLGAGLIRSILKRAGLAMGLTEFLQLRRPGSAPGSGATGKLPQDEGTLRTPRCLCPDRKASKLGSRDRKPFRAGASFQQFQRFELARFILIGRAG